MTAGEQMISAIGKFAAGLGALSPSEILLNAALTLMTILAGAVVSHGIRWLFRYGARRVPGPPNAERQVRVSRATRITSLIIRIGVTLAALFVIAGVWGLDLATALSVALGRGAFETAVRLGLMLVATVVVLELAGFLINHAIGGLAANAVGRRRRAQLNTLGPLMRGVAQSVILMVAGLMLLGELGVQIGPLLAGVGVVGIAVGFGAQTLVKDFLTGAFLVIENIVSVGDVVRIGDCGGLVEEMTLRTIRLRDFDGILHVFPYGEAQVVHNLTKSFSYYVFDLQISYGSDIDRAIAIMRRVGGELQRDPSFGEKILEPIEVVGVDGLAASGVSLKARVKTAPIEQWNVGREYNRRIKLAFDHEGIDIPFPHMQVVLPEGQLAKLLSR